MAYAHAWHLTDSLGNREVLLAQEQANGTIRYSLSGATSGVPFSISNMQLQRPLPAMRSGRSAADMTTAIRAVIRTSIRSVTGEEGQS